AVGKFLRKEVDTGARWHGRSYRYNLVVLARLFDQALAKNFRVLRGARFRFGLRTGRDIELDHAMIFVGGSFGGCVALSPLRFDVGEDRTCLPLAHRTPHLPQNSQGL